MAQGFRPQRVADQIRAELSEILAREVHDPGLGFVTLTRVVVTADLQLARAYYTTLGGPTARRDTARALRRALPFVRRQVGQRVRLRRVPELEFLFDESIEQQDRVDRLINELHEQDTPDGESASRDDDPGDHDDDPAGR